MSHWCGFPSSQKLQEYCQAICGGQGVQTCECSYYEDHLTTSCNPELLVKTTNVDYILWSLIYLTLIPTLIFLCLNLTNTVAKYYRNDSIMERELIDNKEMIERA